MFTHLTVFGILGALCVIAIGRPAVAMAAAMIVFGLEQWAQAKNDFYLQNGLLLNAICSLVLLYAIVIRGIKGQPVFKPANPVVWATVALFTWSLLSIVWSTGPEYSIGQWKEKLPYVVGVMFLLPLVVANTRDLSAALRWALCICAVITLLLLFTVNWAGRRVELSDGTGIGNLSGVAMGGNPLAVASLAGWTTLMALGLNFRGMAVLWWIPRIMVAVFGIWLAYLSGSRGQFFAIFISLVFFIPLSKRMFNNPLSFMAGVVALGVIGYVGASIYAAEGDWRWSLAGMSTEWGATRLGTSEMVLSAWLESSPVYWVIGLGSSASFRPEVLGGYPHLVMAEVLAELGVVGFALLWAVVLYAFRGLWRMWPIIKDKPVERGAVMTLGALFLFEVVLSFKQGSLLGHWYAFAFAMMIGRVEKTVLQQHAYDTWYAQATGMHELPLMDHADDLDPVSADVDVFGPGWADTSTRPQPAGI